MSESLNTKAKTASIAATKAKTAADDLARKAVEAKAAAEKAGGLNTTLNAQAETAAAAATQAKANADNLATVAATKNAEAKRANTLASTTATAATIAEAEAEAVGTAATTASGAAASVKTVILGGLTSGLGFATTAQTAFNAAMMANPVGTVAAAMAALVVTAGLLGKALNKTETKYQKLKKSQDDFVESADEALGAVEETVNAFNDQMDAAKSTAKANKDLAEEIEQLVKVEKKSADQKALLQSRIDSLNASMEGLNLAYDEETNTLNTGNEALKSRVEAYSKVAEAQTAEEQRVALLEAVNAAEVELAKATERKLELQSQMHDELRNGGEQLAGYTSAIEEAAAKEQEAKDYKEQLIAQQKSLDAAVTIGSAAQAAAVSESVSTQIDLYSSLSESAESTLSRVTDAYGTMVSGLTGLNKELKLDTETTWKKVQDNQTKALEYTQEFSDLYSQAIKAGISESYLNAIGVTGPEALPLLRGMMEEGWGTVVDSQSDWEAAYKGVGDTFANSFEMGDAERTAISEYVTGSAGLLGTMQSSIDGADWSGTGMSIGQGIADSIKEGAPLSNEAMQGLVEEAKTAVADADFATPAQKWASDIATNVTEGSAGVKTAMTGLGTDGAAGYAAGFESGAGGIKTAASSGVLAGIEAARAAQNSNSPSVVYQGLGTDAIAGYVLGITGSQGTLGAAMAAAMQVAIKAAKTTMSNGLRSVISSAGTSFNLLGSLAKTGMNGMNVAIKSGTVTAKASFITLGASAKSGMNIMNTVINTGMATSNRTIVTKMKANESTTKSGMSAMQTATKAGMSQMTSAIAAGMATANSRVASGNSSMIAKVRSLQSSFYSAGVNASQGLANGINARAGAAIAAASNLANRVTATMRNALQIHSPSRVTEKIGEYTAEGAAEGILNKIGYIQRISDKLAEAMVPTTSISDRLAYAGDYSFASSDDMLNYVSNQTYTIYVTSEMDGRKVGYGSATYTQEAMEKQTRINSRRAGIR